MKDCTYLQVKNASIHLLILKRNHSWHLHGNSHSRGMKKDTEMEKEMIDIYVFVRGNVKPFKETLLSIYYAWCT